MVRHRVGWALFALTVALFVLGDLYAAGGGAAAADLNESQIEMTVHAEINDARVAHGVAPLQHSPRLATTARAHSAWMADTAQLAHSESETYACGYAGENIAFTYPDGDIQINKTTVVDLNNNETRIGERLVAGWLNSPPHRENILDPRFSAEGIGINASVVDGRQRVYATQALCA